MGKQEDKNVSVRSVFGKDKMRQLGVRAFGVVLIVISTVLYVQLSPLIYVFIGSYMGIIPTIDGLAHADLLIWGMASLSILIPYVYAYIRLIRFFVRRLVRYSAP